MSIENPFGINGYWKIDPDNRQDRSSGPVTTRQMTKAEKIKYGIAVEGEDDMKITKAAVRKMAASGMSNNDIAEHFMPHYPKMTKGRMMAKVSALLSDKAGRPAKEKIDAKGVKRICPDCVPAKRESCDGIPEECVGDQEELKITEVAERVKDEVSKATRDSMEKIKLSQAVDEMMELVPDSRKPVKYYIATGYPHRGRAKQLGDVIKAVGGEITCEWWLDDESGDIAELAEIGRKEFQGIRDCDVLVCLLPGYQGTHTELGAAVILGKKVIIHDADTVSIKPLVPCYYQDNVKWIYGSELQLVAELLKVTA